MKLFYLIAAIYLAAVSAPAHSQLPASVADQVRARATQAGFGGVILIGEMNGGHETLTLGPNPVEPDAIWRWASITKQVVATLVMQEVAKGTIYLDKPVGNYLPGFRNANAAKISVRQLLRHQSGLPNPDDTAESADAFPAFHLTNYAGSRDPLTGYCAGPAKGEPGGNWAYNNCDYMIAGALLEAVTGRSWKKLVTERVARPLKLRTLGAFPTRLRTVPGTVDGKAEPAIQFDSFGAAAGLYGSVVDLWAFDRALMAGKLLPEAQRAELWDGRPALGFMALGQWVFTAPLKGCVKPMRIVERRGEIGGVGARNFMLPDLNIAVIAFTNKIPFDFGEVWQGKGLSFDLLSAAACTP